MTSCNISNRDLNILSIIHQLKTCFYQGLAIDRNGLLLAVRSDKVAYPHHHTIIHVHMWTVDCFIVFHKLLLNNILRLEVRSKCSTTRTELCTLSSTATALGSGDPQVGSQCLQYISHLGHPRYLCGRQICLHRGHWGRLCEEIPIQIMDQGGSDFVIQQKFQ